MENYEIDKLQQFVERYEKFQRYGMVLKQKLSVEERDMVCMMIIDFCCISEQDPEYKHHSAWHNEDIDDFIYHHANLYIRLKTIRDSLIAHLDHNISKQQRVMYVADTMCIYTSLELKEFYELCKQIIKKDKLK